MLAHQAADCDGARSSIGLDIVFPWSRCVARRIRSQITGKLVSSSPDNYQRLLFAAIARLCGDALICTDLDEVVTGWNESAARMYGYSAEEMIGTTFSRIVPESSRSREAEVLNQLPADGTRRYEPERITKTSTLLRVFSTVSTICNDAGAASGAVRMEREVPVNSAEEESQSRLAAIVESSDDAIVSKDVDGIVTSWNQAASRLFGHTAEEMIGQSILKIIPTELHFEEAEILRKIRAGTRIEHYETMRLRKDGQMIEVSLTISPIKDSRGHIIGVSKIAREISQKKKMERLLIQSEKLAATGRMAATIAHEINNPLDSVMNLVYLARTMLPGNSKALPYLMTAESELERVSHIARQTLGYYRDPGPPSEIHLEHLLEEVLRVYRSKLLAGSVAVDCAFTHIRAVRASKDELMQIFSNLIINAVDAMPEGGVLNIETRQIGEAGIEISVRDKGTGISRENLDRVFEPFFSTKGDRGTGIGLWVARQLLEKRGGSIHLQSSTEFPQNGTTVSVFLPFQT
jgi:PAS domain S-box-containing protein